MAQYNITDYPILECLQDGREIQSKCRGCVEGGTPSSFIKKILPFSNIWATTIYSEISNGSKTPKYTKKNESFGNMYKYKSW